MKTTDDRLKSIEVATWTIIWVLMMILIAIVYSCKSVQHIPDYDTFDTLSWEGGIFTEYDTIIGNDTLYYWK